MFIGGGLLDATKLKLLRYGVLLGMKAICWVYESLKGAEATTGLRPPFLEYYFELKDMLC